MGGHRGRKMERDLAPVGQRRQQGRAFGQHRPQRHRLDRYRQGARFDPGQVQHFIDQHQQVLA
ncbi:hypothetical protein LP419_40410 [Massilia sp. H-1]|nr:hypothetical protein LP419_40410 [Massilia sp. H-1]